MLLAASPITLTAKLVKNRFVFAEGGHAPMSHGHHDSEIQDGAEHQHERDGQGEDQDGEEYQLGHGHNTPDGGQDPIERAELGEGPVGVKAGNPLGVILGQDGTDDIE